MRMLLVAGIFLCGLIARGQTNVESDAIPPDVLRTIREANLQHDEAMRKRFDPALQDLAQNLNGDPVQYYSNAVYTVFFSTQAEADRQWRDWQKENRSLLEDPRLPMATQVAALYLKGQLSLVIGQQSDALDCFTKVMDSVASGPRDLAGFPLLQESLKDSLLVRYYQIPKEYFDGDKDSFYGPINQVEKLFKVLILPRAKQLDPANIDTYWTTAITAIGNVASLNDAQQQEYTTDDYPRLIMEEAKCLEQVGKKKLAASLVEQLLTSYPDSPHYKDFTTALIEANQP